MPFDIAQFNRRLHMKSPVLSRRHLMRGLGVGASAAMLPFLRTMPVYAQPGIYPKRLIMIVGANGSVYASTASGVWGGGGSDTSIPISPGSVLSPFLQGDL